ncbi:hypothetical protein M5689_000342 [Euphorbia peplus]|nr:hypothetical protein M5689_000342 [Euphorbia peplus]
MATVSLHLLFVLFSFALFIRGNGQCGIADHFVVKQTLDGSIGNQTKWVVNVINDCICTKTDLRFDCNGFQSALPIDPKVLSKKNGVCFYNGGPLQGFHSFTFAYAWDHLFPFKVIGGNVQCS